MTANIGPTEPFDNTLYATTEFKNILVSGCSFVYNNSKKHVCTWPYYLRDITNLDEVIDVSHSGAGNSHVFNSIVNEVEFNDKVNPVDTLVIIMFSGLSRIDLIATPEITSEWHHMSNYHFNENLSTLSLFHVDKTMPRGPAYDVSDVYVRNVPVKATIFQNCLYMITLSEYLKSKNFKSVITFGWNMCNEYALLSNDKMYNRIKSFESTLQYLGQYADMINQLEPDGHPNTEAHLLWTKEHLLPYMESVNYAKIL